MFVPPFHSFLLSSPPNSLPDYPIPSPRMDSSKKMRSSVADLTDDLVVEIFSRLPVKSICRFKCVSRHWRRLITHPDHRKKLPQTLSGFFRAKFRFDHGDSIAMVPDLVSLSRDEELPVSKPSLSFLPGYESIIPKDSCNGLLLCLCWKLTPAGKVGEYAVCNPATEEWLVLPDPDEDSQDPICLGFDPAVSSHFHVFSMIQDAEGYITAVNIYSSERGAWSPKEIGWGDDIFIYSRGVFLNGMLHFISFHSTIVAVDREGEKWRTIPLLETMVAENIFSLNAAFIEQSQGRLHYLNVRGRDASTLAVWILENYLSDEWVFKYNISTSQLFGFKGGIIGLAYTFIAIHPECNLIFYILNEDTVLQAYDMDRGEVHVIHDHVDLFYGACDTYLPYVPLFRVID